MAGLLQKLQKPTSQSKRVVQEVLVERRPKEVSTLFVLDQVVEDGAMSSVATAAEEVTKTATFLLTQVVPSESDSRTPNSAPLRLTPSQSLALSSLPGEAPVEPSVFGEAASWWLGDTVEKVPQVEALVPAAMNLLDVETLNLKDEFQVAESVRAAIRKAMETLRDEVRLTRKVQDLAERELLGLLLGKGPLALLYDDSLVTDVFVDSFRSIKVLRSGHAMETPFSFRSREEYSVFVRCLLRSAERELSQYAPIIDCVLPDECRSRVSAIDPSVLEDVEPRLCIRIPRLQKIGFYDILQTKTLPAMLASWLAEVVALGEANILVLGPAGSGKTVMTTALLSAVNSDERIITIEDVPELFVPTLHLEKLVARPPDADGKGEVTMPDLLRAALRRAPHRIVVGEIRDEEGRIFLRALETGHAGSIATIHGENAKDALWRLLDLVAAYEQAPQASIMRRIARSVHLTISMKRIDGHPCLTEVSEVSCTGDGDFVVNPIVSFDCVEKGQRVWRLHHGESHWVQRVKSQGLSLTAGPRLRAATD